MKWFAEPIYWATAGAFLSILAGVLVEIKQRKESEERTHFERQLREKSEEIASLNHQIAGLVTGGDSFCWCKLVGYQPAKHQATLMLFSQGDFPLYDVTARIVNLQNFEAKVKTQPLTLENVLAGDMNISFGNLPKGAGTLKQGFPVGAGERYDYNIFFSARNGMWTEMLRIRVLPHQFLCALKVIRQVEGKEVVLYEHFDEGFPKEGFSWESTPPSAS